MKRSEVSDHYIACDAFLCRTNVRKMKSQGRVIQQQKLRRPTSDEADRENVPVTPCTTGRAPDQTGRIRK